MFRLASQAGARAAVPRAAASGPARQATAAAAADAGLVSDAVQNEQWSAVDIDIASGDAHFTALTDDELAAGRDAVVGMLNAGEAGSDSGDSVDADDQMQQIQQHSSGAVQQPQHHNIYTAAMSMVRDPLVQSACFESLRTNPEVRAAFADVAARYGLRLELTGAAAGAAAAAPVRLALEGPPAPAAAERAAPRGLPALLSAIGETLGDVGAIIAAYVQRMRRRVANLLRLLRLGDPEPEGDGKGGAAADGDGDAVFLDTVFSLATLIVMCAFLGRVLARAA